MNLEKLAALADALPEAYKANATALITRMGEKIEGIGDKPVEWRPHTLRLVQAMSDRSKLPKGTNIGDLLLGESVVKTPFGVIVLRSWDGRQYWSPDQNEAKMLCSSPDAKLGYIGVECRVCPHSKYDEEAKKIDCNKIKSFMVIASDLSDVFNINFAKTNFKTGGEWESLMKKANVSPYRRIYGIKSEASKQYKNVETISIETYEGDKRDSPAEILPFLAELFQQVGNDRKEMVDNFHKVVLSRKQDPALLTSNSGADSDIVLIEGTSTEPSSDTPAPAKKSDHAKRLVL